MVTTTLVTEDEVRSLLDAVVDPDIPVLTIADIGVLRDVGVAADGRVTITITPTYSGCPAMGVIQEDIESVLRGGGVGDVEVVTRYVPTWTTDWMDDSAKARLLEYGISPPAATQAIVAPVVCPQCRSASTKVVSEFGSTACKALMVCSECSEPFDHFKAI